MRTPTLLAVLRRLIRKRKRGEITPQEYAQRKLVITRCQYMVPARKEAK